MKLRIYETNNLQLETVGKMLLLADKQANFRQESRWVLSFEDGELDEYSTELECTITKRYIELCVKWIGREAVIMWLLSNQIIFEIVSHDFLDVELEVLGETEENDEISSEPVLLN